MMISTNTLEVILASPEDARARAKAAPVVQSPDIQRVDYSKIVVPKPWGHEHLLFENEFAAVWVLHIRTGCQTSMHCHAHKKTSLVVLKGSVRFSTLLFTRERRPGEGVLLGKGVFHQTRALSAGGAWVMEVETPPDKHDLIRLADEYGRVGLGYGTPDAYAFSIPNDDYFSFDARIARERLMKHFGSCNLSFLRLSPSRTLPALSSWADADLVCLLSGELRDARGRKLMEHGDILPATALREGGCICSAQPSDVLVTHRRDAPDRRRHVNTMRRKTEPSLHVETVSNIYNCASNPRALQTFGQMIDLRRQACDFNRLPIYACDYVARHHLVYLSDDGKDLQPVAGGAGVLLSDCDAVSLPFPALEGMREVNSELLMSAISRMVTEHRTSKTPLGYAFGFTILKPFRRNREVLKSLVELLAALMVEDFIAQRVSRVVAFGIVGRSTRLIARLGFSIVADTAFPSPYLPGDYAAFFEMTQPSPWAFECRDRWAPILFPQRRQLASCEVR